MGRGFGTHITLGSSKLDNIKSLFNKFGGRLREDEDRLVWDGTTKDGKLFIQSFYHALDDGEAFPSKEV